MTKRTKKQTRKGPGHAKGKTRRVRVTKTVRVLDYVMRNPKQTRKQIYHRFKRYKKSTISNILYRASKQALLKVINKQYYKSQKKYYKNKYGTTELIIKKWYEHFIATKTHSKRRVRGKNRRIDLYALTYAPFSSKKKDLSYWLLRDIRRVTGYDAEEYAYQGTKEKHGQPEWEQVEVGRIEGTRYEVIEIV